MYFRKPALVTRTKTGKWEAGNAAQEVAAGPGDRSPGLHWDRRSVGRDGTEGRIQKLPRQQLRNGRVKIK